MDNYYNGIIIHPPFRFNLPSGKPTKIMENHHV